MAGPRVYAQMAADRVMPKLFASRKGIPRRAIMTQAILSIIVCWVTGLPDLIGYLGLTLSACGALAIASIWWLPNKIQSAKPIRVYEHLCATLFVVMSVVLLAAAYSQMKVQFWACIATFVVGAIVYVVSSQSMKSKARAA